MATIGVLVPPVPGHLNPSTSLGRSLRDRGHNVIVFVPVDAEHIVTSGGLKSQIFAKKLHPKGDLKRRMEYLGTKTGIGLLQSVSIMFAESTQAVVDEIPCLMKQLNIDLMIVDETQPGAGSICQHLEVPFVVISNALTLSPDPAIPPFFTPNGPATNIFGRLMNLLLYKLAAVILHRKSLLIVQKARKEWGLEPVSARWDEHADQVHISQEPKAFTFPRDNRKENIHFLGPFFDARRGTTVQFPWDRLNMERPLIYASLGTLQNRLRPVFHTIAKACEDEDAQLVISLGGGGLDPKDFGDFAGDPIVVGFAPQLELLDRATACITHAGMNTTLECLARGIPMVALPVGSDQPGVAARIAHCGAGISLNTPTPTVEALRNAVHRVLTEPIWGENAQKVAKSIDPAAARAKACELIENLLDESSQRKGRLSAEAKRTATAPLH